ncbi:MAG: transcriptional regulator [Thermoplasmatales archaeon]|nr:transcriptional regulator [Thermoplasmatales archaeon]
MKEEIIRSTQMLLTRAGFYCSQICKIRPSSFDFIARRDNLLLIIKILNNIDSISEDSAKEMISVARFLGALPIIVGDRTCSTFLEDDIVYFRYGVPILTIKTLENYVRGRPPVVCAAPGGFYVNIDGEVFSRLKREKGLSIGQLARIAGVSRKTIQMYEKGERASVDVAERLASYIGYDFIKPITLFEEVEKEEIETKEIKNEMLKLMEEIGAFIFPTYRSPFHAVSKLLDEIFIVGINDRRIFERARIISNISKVTERRSVILAEKSNVKIIEGVPIIEKDELRRVREPEELIGLLEID